MPFLAFPGSLDSLLPAHLAARVPPQLDVHQLLTRWSFAPIPAIALLGIAGLYFSGVRVLTKRGDAWAWQRSLGFVGGVVVAAYAILGGLGAYDGTLFSAHTAQHMLLAMVVPVLLALGAPITLALRTLPARPRAWLLKLLHGQLGALLASPFLGLALMAATPFVLYFSGIYPYTLDHNWAHYLLHLHFVTVGCIFFWPILGIDVLPHRPPHWARVLALFIMLPFHAFLGIALMTGDGVIAAAHYAALGRTWGASAHSDQVTGGGLVWATGDLLSGFLFLTVLMQWAKADEKEARRIDRALDRAEALELREQGTSGQHSQDPEDAEDPQDAALAAYNARLARLAEDG